MADIDPGYSPARAREAAALEMLARMVAHAAANAGGTAGFQPDPRLNEIALQRLLRARTPAAAVCPAGVPVPRIRR